MFWKIFFIALGLFNLFTFILMAYDKSQAGRARTRVAEIRFFNFALFGGSVGILLAMPLLRHKNRKWSFKGRIYSIAGGQILLLIFLWRYLF